VTAPKNAGITHFTLSKLPTNYTWPSVMMKMPLPELHASWVPELPNPV